MGKMIVIYLPIKAVPCSGGQRTENKGGYTQVRDNKLLGKLGEDLAASLLYSEGYDIRCRNYRTRRGEIDIVCEKDDVLCFTEVKTRTCDFYGMPEEAVDKMKQKRIRDAAYCYMVSNQDEAGKNAVFKVVEIMIRETDDMFMQL